MNGPNQLKKTLICVGIGVLLSMSYVPYIEYAGPPGKRYEKWRTYRWVYERMQTNNAVNVQQLAVNVLCAAVAGALLSVIPFHLAPKKDKSAAWDSRDYVPRK